MNIEEYKSLVAGLERDIAKLNAEGVAARIKVRAAERIASAERALRKAKDEAYRTGWALDSAERDVSNAGEYVVHPNLYRLPELQNAVRSARVAVDKAESDLRALGVEP